jgi:rhamnose transport system ATP-binding protein
VSTPVLEAKSVSKRFAGVQALREVSFDLAPGEVHAIVGENGAGKSTLVSIFTGAETPDAGELFVRGRAVTMDPTTAKSLGIAVIYQHPSLFPDLSVAENIAFAHGSPSPWRRVDWRECTRVALDVLARTGVSIDPERTAASLSMPEQQVIEIAKALGAEAAILIMDEPTASLADQEAERLLQIAGRLRDQGVAIVYISHRLEEVFRVADRVTVLRDGESVVTKPVSELSRDALIHFMVGRDVAMFPKRAVSLGEIALELRHVSNHAAGIRDVSLGVRHGEVLGVAGLVGSGRTELGETIFGLRTIESGEVRLDGNTVEIKSPADAIRQGLAYVPEDRSRHGVVGDMTVAANSSLANLSAVARGGFIDRHAERRDAERHVEQLKIKTPSVDEPVASLSGGNQQKVALARWLSVKPKVLILDEPTQGVDIGAKAEIHEIINSLVAGGTAVVMISSELPDVLGLSDRIAVMRRGSISGILTRDEATPQTILDLALHDVTAQTSS